MPDSPLDQLLGRARGPMGPAIDLDFGFDTGPLQELGALLSRMNGFFVFNAGVQVFRAGDEGLGPDLLSWNSDEVWKSTYEGLADHVFCFGQDLFGTQFAIVGGERVVTFNPETADVKDLGAGLDDWAAWLLSDPDVNGVASFAHAFQQQNGALTPDQRLVPLQFFVAGGEFAFENLVVRESGEAMRIRGPIAQKIHELPDGATLRLGTTQ
ncbi:SMI1/KNR4 family protein [Kitasatospora sp. NPDC058046]|uniref:SMI1/KNR4 family protein n=1 Tax=Kitasatospora sp. NPDC058046 TaxID=3346312 RepID=UPI0036DCF880